MIYTVSINEAWEYLDSIVPSINIGTFSDALGFFERLSNNVVMVALGDSIHYAENLNPGPGEFNLSWSDTLDYSETITPKDIIAKYGDVLQLIDVFARIGDHRVLDTLIYSDDLVTTTAKGLHDTFEYEEVWSFEHTRTILMADTIVLMDHSHGYFNDPWRSHYPVLT